MFFTRTQRRAVMVLNLVALIDISAMIIIFLIMGAIFGESSMSVPPGIVLPKSNNTETVENAPRIVIQGNSVSIGFLNQEVDLRDFQSGREPSVRHLEAVQAYLNSIPVSVRKSGVLLNLVADQNTPYRDVFDVVAYYRKAGFQSVLFVARGQ